MGPALGPACLLVSVWSKQMMSRHPLQCPSLSGDNDSLCGLDQSTYSYLLNFAVCEAGVIVFMQLECYKKVKGSTDI